MPRKCKAVTLDVARLQVQVSEAGLRSNERLAGLTAQLAATSGMATGNATAIARLTSEAIAARETLVAMYKSQQDAIAKADMANEKRFQAVNEFRAQLGDQARTFMPRAEVEVMLKAFDSRLDKIEGQQTERAGLKTGTKEGWLYAVGVIGLIATILGLLALFKKG